VVNGAGPRGPYAGTAERRRKIISAAFDAFAQGGFRGSSLQEISDAVGMSKAGLLHHVGTKEALLQAVLELREEMIQPPADVHGLDMLVHLRKTARVDNATRGAVALFVTMSAEATNPSHPAHRFFVMRYEATVTAIANALDEARALGDLNQGVDAVEASRLIVSVMDGLQLQMLLHPALDRLAAFDTYLEQFLVQNVANDYERVWRRVFSDPPRAVTSEARSALGRGGVAGAGSQRRSSITVRRHT
jgi:AcrR family transcriptional regulator